MGNILSGLVLVNGTDIWTEYGVFLVDVYKRQGCPGAGHPTE